MSGPVYFLSDLHVSAPDGPRTESLLAFLRGLRGEARAIYLVGDVFDLWLGYRSALFSAYFPLLRCLAELVEAGTEVVLFSGNHDPDPGAFLGTLGLRVREEPLSLRLGGRRVWVSHGDLINPHSRTQRLLCRLARHPAARALARRIHPDTAWALSRRYARRTPETYEERAHPALITELLPARAALGDEVVILGHLHRALHHRVSIDGRERALYILGDWIEQRTYLRYAEGAFTLLRHRGAAPPEVLPPGDHAPPHV